MLLFWDVVLSGSKEASWMDFVGEKETALKTLDEFFFILDFH